MARLANNATIISLYIIRGVYAYNINIIIYKYVVQGRYSGVRGQCTTSVYVNNNTGIMHTIYNNSIIATA